MSSAIEIAVVKARDGVDYSVKSGATCPMCGKKKIKVMSSPRWMGEMKVRYHKCQNPDCLLGKMGTLIKSVQVA